MAKWTPYMQERLRSLAEVGMKYTDIAATMAQEFGTPLTKNAVIGMAQRIGVPQRIQTKHRPARYTPRVLTSRKRYPDAFALEDLGQSHCRWPIKGTEPPFGYCGATIIPNGRPYCFTHATLAYPALRAK
jgi:hypothetical protein